MPIETAQKNLVRMLPGIDHLLALAQGSDDFTGVPRTLLVRTARLLIDHLRNRILSEPEGITPEDLAQETILVTLKQHIDAALAPNLKAVVNATGVVVHTNLGRSLLAQVAIENTACISGRYSNLEFDLEKGVRGSRYVNVEDLLCEISGAEAAMVVNNNAGAVLLCLDTLARGKEVIVSRGELIEIGGAFRIPDVMAKSGAILKEVGTTNRTHLHDYERAIENDTALLLKVHTSNYSIVGFTAELGLADMVKLGAKYHLPVMQDLGSGTFIDFSKYGLLKEPTVQESVQAGAQLITFSGDKLLGGPQAGIIVGKKEFLDQIKQNPLTRALRIDKMTLAALEQTLRLYRSPDEAVRTIPTLNMLTLPLERIEERAEKLVQLLTSLHNERIHIQKLARASRAGGGSLPLLEIPSRCVGVVIDRLSAHAIDTALRESTPPVIGRIEEDLYLMDLRTICDEELPVIAAAFETLLEKPLK